MLNILAISISVIPIALRRLWANRGIALCALLAVLVAVALTISVPVYAEAAQVRLLQNELERQEQQTGRSPFALLFRYVAAWNGPVTWERAQLVDSYLQGPGLDFLGLPVEGLGRHARTPDMQLVLPASGADQSAAQQIVSLGFLSGLDGQIAIVDGAAPRPAADLRTPVEALLMKALADRIGVNVGDELRVVTTSGTAVTTPIRVAGLWQPLNPRDPAWFYPPDAFEAVVLVNEMTFAGPVAAQVSPEMSQVLWFARLSAEGLQATTANQLLDRMRAVQARIAGVIPGLRLEQSPAQALEQYQAEASALTLQLFVFSTPLLGLVFYFAALVAAQLIARQRAEIALLKSRGVHDAQIVGLSAVEWLMMSLVAFPLGAGLGLVFALTMGRMRSFLSLDASAPTLAIALRWSHLRFGVGVVALLLLAALIPAQRATRRTLVDEQQEAARMVRPPLWQRLFLDVLLLLVSGYGIFQLRRSGGLQLGTLSGSDPLGNPLLLLLPALLCLALGLLAVRLIRQGFELLARLAMLPSWVAPLVAVRELARQSAVYRGPLLLLILTLSLATFTSSMAATLDTALRRAVSYQVGAVMQLRETGDRTTTPADSETGGQSSGTTPGEEQARFLFVPVDAHLAVPGVTAAARVGTYEAIMQTGGANRVARLIGIDRLAFPQTTALFDPAWADGQSLGALMNQLASSPNNIIVSRDVLNSGVAVGDALPVTLRIYDDQREVVLRIAAAVDYWPGVYPQDGPFLIANLSALFDQMGGEYPYDVWIAHVPEARPDSIVTATRAQGIVVVDALNTAAITRQEETHPRRQGLLGLLSVGFISAALLTLLGFVLSLVITARRRAIELGILQALGLSRRQVALTVAMEQVILVVVGAVMGSAIGFLAAWLVVPMFQVSFGPHPGTPPTQAQVAWDQGRLMYLVVAATLLVTLLVVTMVLRRMRLIQAVKLGDTN